MNKRPDLIFQALPEAVREGNNLVIQWTSSISSTLLNVEICLDEILIDDKLSLGTVYSNSGIFIYKKFLIFSLFYLFNFLMFVIGTYTWRISNVFETKVWNYYLKFSYNCKFAGYHLHSYYFIFGIISLTLFVATFVIV